MKDWELARQSLYRQPGDSRSLSVVGDRIISYFYCFHSPHFLVEVLPIRVFDLFSELDGLERRVGHPALGVRAPRRHQVGRPQQAADVLRSGRHRHAAECTPRHAYNLTEQSAYHI